MIQQYFGQISPPPLTKRFEICFKSFFESIPAQKTVSDVLKTWYFPYSAFWSTGQWRALAPTLTILLRLNVLLSSIVVYYDWVRDRDGICQDRDSDLKHFL